MPVGDIKQEFQEEESWTQESEKFAWSTRNNSLQNMGGHVTDNKIQKQNNFLLKVIERKQLCTTCYLTATLQFWNQEHKQCKIHSLHETRTSYTDIKKNLFFNGTIHLVNLPRAGQCKTKAETAFSQNLCKHEY